MNRSESKYFSTAVKMDKAFLELIEKKDFAYITVKEICEKAGVNRSTFYLHYETVGDLLNESAQYIISEFTESMPHNTVDFIGTITERPLDELYLITPEYLTPYLTYVKEHRRIFKTAVEHASLLQMNDAYRDLNRYILDPILDRFKISQGDRKYIMQFYISGIMAIINEWLESDCKDDIEHIVSVIQRCIKQPPANKTD